MKYQDNLQKGFVNAQVVGTRIGTPMADVLAPEDDGYDDVRSVEHIGTVLQDADANAYNPEPEEEAEED